MDLEEGSIINKFKLSWGRFSMGTVLFLGFMVLGLGCISLAIFHIWPKSDDSVSTVYASEGTRVGSDSSMLLSTPEVALYPVYPADGDNIGSLTIPALKQTFPIIQGTGTDELEKGVGHFAQTVLPGEDDNCVLSGHRDTVFTKLGELKIGDQLIVKTSAGIFTYKIKNSRIVDKDDRTVIVPTDHAVLTLTTCYPFRFIGNAQRRYILTADLMSSK